MYQFVRYGEKFVEQNEKVRLKENNNKMLHLNEFVLPSCDV